MTVYSYSRLEKFQNCPHQYKLTYINKIEAEEEGIEAFMGKMVHTTLEKVYKDLRMSKSDSLDDVWAYYKQEWNKNWHDNIVITKKEFTAENYFETGQKCIERYFKRFKPFNQAIAVWIENKVFFELGLYKFNGVVDRLDKLPDGSFEIHDYKAGGYLPSQEDMDGNRQLALYQIAVQQEWNDIDNVRLVWHYLQYDQDIISTRTSGQLEEVKKDCIALIERIETEKDFRPTPSSLCDWCPYWEYCPEKKHLVQIERMKPVEAASEDGFVLVNRFAKLKAQEKALNEEMELVRAQLIDYSKKMAASKVRGSAHVASVSIQTRTSLPSRSSEKENYDKIVDILQEAGIWEDFSVMDASRLLKALDSGQVDSVAAKAIGPFVVKEERVGVRLSKLKDDEE